MAAAGVLLVALGFVAGSKLSDEASGLRVNGSELAATVWEGSEATAGTTQPPTCEPQTDDGIGDWNCTYFSARNQPVEGTARVASDGSVTAAVKGQRITGCCLDLRD